MLKKNSIVNSIDCPRKMPRKRRGRRWIFVRCRGRPWIFFPAVPITSHHYLTLRHDRQRGKSPEGYNYTWFAKLKWESHWPGSWFIYCHNSQGAQNLFFPIHNFIGWKIRPFGQRGDCSTNQWCIPPIRALLGLETRDGFFFLVYFVTDILYCHTYTGEIDDKILPPIYTCILF